MPPALSHPQLEGSRLPPCPPGADLAPAGRSRGDSGGRGRGGGHGAGLSGGGTGQNWTEALAGEKFRLCGTFASPSALDVWIIFA